MIRLGAIGGGMVFARYFAAAERLPEVKLVSLADPDPRCRAYWTSKGCHCVPTIEDLLQNSFDGLLVLTPNHTHSTFVLQCLESGADVLCEKPLALNVGEAEKLFDCASARGVLLYPAMHLRHRPEIKYLFEHCVGQVEAFQQVWLEDWTTSPAWYRNPKLSGGGVLLDVGINQIDWMLSLLADLTPVSATARGYEGTVEQECSVEWLFDGGSGRSDLSWRGLPQRRHTHIRMANGRTFHMDHDAGNVLDNGIQYGPWPDDEYAGVLREFLAVRNGKCGIQRFRTIEALKLIQEIYALTGLSFFNENSERSLS